MLSHLKKDFSEEQQERILYLAGGYGLLMSKSLTHQCHLPISLLPTQFSGQLVQEITELTPDFNLLMYNVHLDRKWIFEVLDQVGQIDDFTGRLLFIAKKKETEGWEEPGFLGMNRNDFMLDKATQSLKQVEFNTMASSFGALATKIPKLHKLILSQYSEHFQGVDPFHVKDNCALNKLSESIAKAHEVYNSSASVMFLVLSVENNYFDQVYLEKKLWENWGIPVVRASLMQVYERGFINERGCLIYQNQEISVVYMRAGYSPDHYQSESEWKARELIDLSRAIKTPNIFYHLAGTKRVQQCLADKATLSKFIAQDKVDLVSKYFTDLYGFDSELPDELLREVQRAPQNFVLKPQREGGGNNIYGEEILKHFENYESQEVREKLKQYILMRKIEVPEVDNLLARNGSVNKAKTLSELGMFGTLVASGTTVLNNEYAGYLVRTKSSEATEGGVAAGYAVIDSIYLI